ncbi:hypothetical protein ACMFMG_006314 [Clarireedia jacksonii]
MLISKIREAAEKPENSIKGARINITDWLNFFIMDVIEDLAFGAPFGCLEEGGYHHWVRTLFSYLKEKMINRRLDTKTDRPDFMTPFMRNNVNFEKISRAEIVFTFSSIIVGGS